VSSSKGVAAVGFEPTTEAKNPLEKQGDSPIEQVGCTSGCTNPSATSPDLLALLAQLAALPADERAMLAKLLTLPTAKNQNAPKPLDDTLPAGFERPEGTTV
jgi:hypothetical protein